MTANIPQPTVTIAVTVHNREKLIGQCLDSLMAQTFRDIEIICIDDASTDGSYEVLQRHADSDPRIRLYRFEENAGVQRARNHAIMMARGEYITFVDDDDWLSSDCVEQCLECFNENADVDCVLIPEIRQRPDGTQFVPTGRKDFDRITGEEAFLLSLPWQVAGNFFVTTSFQKQHLFDNSCRYFGDENTGRLMLLDARCIVLSKGIYYYRMTESSVCHSIGIGKYSRLRAQRVLADELCRRNVRIELRKAYEDFCWINIIGTYMRYYKERKMMDDTMRRDACQMIKDARQAMNFSLVSPSLKRKFGFVPFLWSWNIFRLQEESYFFLRTLSGRMKIDDNGDPDE